MKATAPRDTLGLVRASLIVLLALIEAAAWAAPLNTLLSPDVAAELERSGTVRRVFRGLDGLALFPRLPMAAEAGRRIAALDPTIGVEMLTAYKPPAGPSGGDPKTIYNALHSVSTLKGIEYFSASRGRLRTFFYDAAFVDAADSDVRLPDPVRAAAPGDGLVERLHAVFEDSTFGRYAADVSYESRASHFSLSFENAGPIRKMLVPVVSSGQLVSTVVVIPADDRIVLYAFSCVRAFNLFGMVERRGEDSFTNRLVALLSWFRATYEARYR